MKSPNLESRFPFFLTLPLTDPTSVGPGPRPIVSLLLLLPEKLRRLPSVAIGLGVARLGEDTGDLALDGELVRILGVFLGRSGEFTGDTIVGILGKTFALEEGPRRRGGRLYGAVGVADIDGRDETSEGRGEGDAKRL